jgi:guanylate kinase
MLNNLGKSEVKLLGNLKKGHVFVISAPAGTGKTTLVKKILKEFPCVKTSISFTTRKPRDREVSGIDYNFISLEEFKKKIDEGEFLEHVELYGDYYGTSKHTIEELQNQGKHVVLVIDTQGGLRLKRMINASLIFIMPPSFEELASRLHKRKSEKPDVIEKRLKWAKNEIEDAKYYDYLIVNDNLKTAYQALRSILIAEEHRVILNK